MIVFKNKDFNKWAKKQKIKDTDLLKAINEIKKAVNAGKLVEVKNEKIDT